MTVYKFVREVTAMKRMGILGLDCRLVEPPPEAIARMYGARVATGEALVAILRYGSVDQYDIFVRADQPSAIEGFRSELKARGVETERVSIVPIQQVRQALTTHRYLAIHDPGTPYLGRLAAAVRPLLLEATPCTCTHHSISYGDMTPTLLDTCVADVHPYDAIFCSSADSRTALKTLFNHLCGTGSLAIASWRHRLEELPLGIHTAEFAPLVPCSVARQILGLPVDGRYVLYVGRLSPIDKADLDVLLRAFAALRHRQGGEGLQLVLAGDDTYHYSVGLRSRAQQLGIFPAVHVLTNITGTIKRLALWAADVFVSPADSVQESFGLTVVEAMAAGLPAVVSDWGGYRDLVVDEVTGFLVPTLWGSCTSAINTQTEFGATGLDHAILSQSVVVDEDALTDRLCRALNDPVLRVSMGQRAQERAARYDWREIVGRYEAVWQALKQEALASIETPRPSARFPFERVFARYPTHQLQSQDIVELRSVAPTIPPPPQALRPLLGESVLQRIRTLLVEGPQRIDTLAQNETDLLGVLWLAKAGVVRVHRTPVLDTATDSVGSRHFGLVKAETHHVSGQEATVHPETSMEQDYETRVMQPVFLHSLFRSGSTYLFAAFRRASAGYYCYEEPLTEHLLNMDPRLFESMEFTRRLARFQNHPDLDRPYKFEYTPIRERIQRYFRKAFPYDLSCLSASDSEPALREYLALLLDAAPGRPVLQFCRSCFRTAWLHANFDAINIYLWRNPRDQWLSYNISPYFPTTNLLILGSPCRSRTMAALAEKIGVEPFYDTDLRKEMSHYASVAATLSPARSYLAFCVLWMLAYLQNTPHADLVINIDQLSDSCEYRRCITERLTMLGLGGLNFDDCHIQKRTLDVAQQSFFSSIERQAWSFLESLGYPEQELACLPYPVLRDAD